MHRAAYSVLELLVCLALALVVCGSAAPVLIASRDGVRAIGATDFLVAQLHAARMEALKRRSNVALRFETDGDDYLLAVYVDGNGNGIRASDIIAGIDSLLRPRERLDQQFAGVGFWF